VAGRHGQALGDQIDREHVRDAEVEGDPARHLPDGPETEHGERPPAGTSANTTACQAVGRTSDRNGKRWSGGPSGTLIGPKWAWGTRISSAWAPGTCP
jgi:hypothetical protein